jgi:hypothetical protein
LRRSEHKGNDRCSGTSRYETEVLLNLLINA